MAFIHEVHKPFSKTPWQFLRLLKFTLIKKHEAYKIRLSGIIIYSVFESTWILQSLNILQYSTSKLKMEGCALYSAFLGLAQSTCTAPLLHPSTDKYCPQFMSSLLPALEPVRILYNVDGARNQEGATILQVKL